jgi:hypothetical protein
VQPTGGAAVTGGITKVVNIWMENHDAGSVIGAAAGAYETQLATTYGQATAFTNLVHPSLPNYIAATSGSTQGVTDDDPPSAHPLSAQSIFGQLEAAGKTWKAYQEGMPSNCAQTSSGRYAVKHNPAAYYVPLRASCGTRDVPMGTEASGPFADDLATSLPDFSFITPDLCNDTHDCAVGTGDAWLQGWIPRIMAGPDYRSGHLAIIVSWDETGGGQEQAEIVVSPRTAGVTVSTPMDHYARLRGLEDLFGLPYLGSAATANPGYAAAFGLTGAGTGTPVPPPVVTAPNPGTPTPVPDLGTPTPVPDPGTPTPVPDLGTPTPVPDPGTPTPVPDPGTPTPVPDPGTPTPVPPSGDDHGNADEDQGTSGEGHGNSGEGHGKSGEDHGRSGDHGKADDDHGKAGDDHGQAVDDHGQAVEDHGGSGASSDCVVRAA